MDILAGIASLGMALLQPTEPNIAICDLFASIFKWLLQIIAGGASLFLLIDMAGHVFRSPRDLRAAGLDTIGMAILIAGASKADVFIRWSFTLLGAAEQCISKS